MTTPGEAAEFSEDTELRCASTTIRESELQRLKEEKVFRNVEKGENGVVDEVDIDFGSLARLMYRYDTLDMSASHVKVDILNVFRTEDAINSVRASLWRRQDAMTRMSVRHSASWLRMSI